MLLRLVYILSYLNAASLLIVLGIGSLHWSRLTPALRLSWLALLAYFGLFAWSLAMVLRWVPAYTQLVAYLISGTFGGCFALAYRHLMPPGWRRGVVAGLGAAGLLGLLIEAVGQGRAHQPSQWAIPLQTVINTLLTLIYWHILLRQTRTSLLNVPFFWIASGVLISSVVGTFYDAFQEMMLSSSIDLLMGGLCVQMSVTILCNGLYAMGFYKAGALPVRS